MIPMRYFSNRGFAAANATSLLLFFGMFGSIFLLAQFLQLVKGYSALEAGVRTLPWTAMLLVLGPLAGFLSDRIGSRRLVVAGTALMAVALGWLAAISSPTVSYWGLAIPFLIRGRGDVTIFRPDSKRGPVSGRPRRRRNRLRRAQHHPPSRRRSRSSRSLAAVFAFSGSYTSPGAFVGGLSSAMWVAAAVVGIAVLAAWFIPTAHTPSASKAHLGNSVHTEMEAARR
jgi:nitrate/nitrite transporter NarK